jgi:hypothetical protein
MKKERRHTRVAVEGDVEMSVQIDRNYRGRVTDISEAGLFVETGSHVEEGNFIVIEFFGETIMFGATVRRVVENGFGAEFGSMDDAHREVISRFIPKPRQARVSSVVQMPTVMLLCDDGLYSNLVHELEEAELAVVEVRSVDKVITSLERFDVVGVVSDYSVGGKETLPILIKIKEQKQQRNFPVIIYSGRYDVPNIKFEEFGIQCYSVSDTSSKNLVSHIKRIFSEDDEQHLNGHLVLQANSTR